MAEGIIEHSCCDSKHGNIDKYTIKVPRQDLINKLPPLEFSLLDYLTIAPAGKHKDEFTSWDMYDKSFGFLIELLEKCEKQASNKLKQLGMLDIYIYDNALFFPLWKYMFTEEGKEECAVFFSFLMRIANEQKFYDENRKWLAGLEPDKKTNLLLYTQIMGIESDFGRIAADLFEDSDNWTKAIKHTVRLNYYGESMLETARDRKNNPRIGGKMWSVFE